MKVDYEESENKKKQKHIIVKSVVWVCPDCGFAFSEQNMKQAKQKYVIQNPQALKSEVRSFFVNGFASPWISWNEIMEEWLKAKGDPEREKVVYNTRFGESYEQVGAFENGDMFLKRREKYEDELVETAIQLMRDNPGHFHSMQDFSKSMYVSSKTFINHFKKNTGTTPHKFEWNMKLNSAASFMREYPNVRLYEVAKKFGFYDEFHFSREFSKKFLISPTEYRKRNAKMEGKGC